MLGHLFGSIFGLTLAIFGTFALGAYLTRSRAGHLGLVAVVITVVGSTLFLPAMGVSTFAVPEEGQAYLAGIEEYRNLPDIFADTMFAVTSLIVIVLGIVYAAVILGVQSTPPTVLVGALLIVMSGAWMAWSVLRQPSSQPTAQPRVS